MTSGRTPQFFRLPGPQPGATLRPTAMAISADAEVQPMTSRLAALLMRLCLVLPGAAMAQAPLEVVTPNAACAGLTATDMTAIAGPGSSVTAATETTSDGIPVCLITGRLAPRIGFQVVLPRESWRQRYLQLGCGGLCGQISLRAGASAGCRVLADGGFVMAATDMGHSGPDARWGEDAASRDDFAWRAQHLTAAAAKALIRAYYGRDAAFSYFNGCSDGGREALMEAMRFPGDFDGVIAGAPAMLFQVQNTLFHGWQARANTDAGGRAILTSDKLPLLHKAVVVACDALDGATDGLIAQPALCSFDPGALTCTGSAGPDCLTPAETGVVRKFYTGPQDARTGAFLTAGQPLYGSELNWHGVYVADKPDDVLMSTMAALAALRYLAFTTPRPDFQLAELQFTTATLDALRPRHPLFDTTNPDLSAFAAAGGKLIIWHGLADPHIAPANSVALHQAMGRQLGAARLRDFERLYLLPGVSHCGGGEGPDNLDLLTPMMDWVETGTAPEAILTFSAGQNPDFGPPDVAGGDRDGPPPQMALPGVTPPPEMTRPVYPYPDLAVYSGAGPPTDAANWTRGAPAPVVRLRDWPGADLFTPYAWPD